jgi:hypothetical protein
MPKLRRRRSAECSARSRRRSDRTQAMSARCRPHGVRACASPAVGMVGEVIAAAGTGICGAPKPDGGICQRRMRNGARCAWHAGSDNGKPTWDEPKPCKCERALPWHDDLGLRCIACGCRLGPEWVIRYAIRLRREERRRIAPDIYAAIASARNGGAT